MDFYETAQEPPSGFLNFEKTDFRNPAFEKPNFKNTEEFKSPDFKSSDFKNSDFKNSDFDKKKSDLTDYIFGSVEVSQARKFLIIEEDTRTRGALQRLILEENDRAVCVFGETQEDVLGFTDVDVVIANYYESEDEVDYEFWDNVRARNPDLKVIILSHLNDREYYEKIEELVPSESEYAPLSMKLKNFFENIFGGRYGH